MCSVLQSFFSKLRYDVTKIEILSRYKLSTNERVKRGVAIKIRRGLRITTMDPEVGLKNCGQTQTDYPRGFDYSDKFGFLFDLWRVVKL